MAEEQNLLIPIDEYLKTGIHIGTKFKTKHMANFIYKTRPDGLYVLNLQKIDERLGILIELISHYAPEDILIVSRRENGWKPVKMFGKFTGATVFAGRYPPGMLTNPRLDIYREAKFILATDAWPDRNAIKDAFAAGIPIAALCDTNNQANHIDYIMPCNNKGKKSLALVFWVLARGYMLKRGMIKSDKDFDVKIEDFTEE
ncbi:30S ribosomal protein S2 [Candidatus Woesearchaeota archaeon]|nr:30S ribosomal protein S2 [Candidatus Woesearchaeota archaeon]